MSYPVPKVRLRRKNLVFVKSGHMENFNDVIVHGSV